MFLSLFWITVIDIDGGKKERKNKSHVYWNPPSILLMQNNKK